MAFELKKAVRSAAPSWIALGGGSGGGKTKSALRLATGIVRVTGGKIAVIDTEADRALVYAPANGKAAPPETFDFEHLSFGAPFSSLRYLEACQVCMKAGASVIIVDSFSHEHESLGGMLEQFEEELERLSGGDDKKAERVQMLAWKKPKMARRQMINTLLQARVSIIGCFRTKEKLKLEKGHDPEKLGSMPITGSEFIYEFPLRLLLNPGSDGCPQVPEREGEKGWVRVPSYFRDFIKPGSQLTEDIGEKIARWEAGGVPAQKAAPPAADPTTDAPTPEALQDLLDAIAIAPTYADAKDAANGKRLKWTTEQREAIRAELAKRAA